MTFTKLPINLNNRIMILKQIRRCCKHYSTMRRHEKVVVTGMGIVSSLGCGVEYVWKKILQGACGISKIQAPGYDKIPCQIAAFVSPTTSDGKLNIEEYVSKSNLRTMSLATVYALIAAKEALEDANWFPETERDKQRTGVAIGMGMNDLEEIVNTGLALRNQGYNRVSPYFIPKILPNMAAGHLSIKYSLNGPNHSVSTACTTGVHSIGDAARLIALGDADVMLCGGTEACISPLSIAAFSRMRALATSFNDTPEKASRPFDKRREGFVMGEGAGILVLESLEHAQKRNAKVYAEILGYGLSGDGYHMTAPREDGLGARLCMEAALRNANIRPDEIGYINAHATSTPIGDYIENQAIKALFGDHAKKLAVSSTKGAIGHLLGAAGSIEAIFTILACYYGQLPPTINLEHPGEHMDLNYVPNSSQIWPTLPNLTKQIALTNSFGFGGTNASLCISANSS